MLAYLIFPFIWLSQLSTAAEIGWSADRPLTWSDYKAKPDPSSGAAASTATFLGFDYQYRNGSLTYKITNTFSPDRSWGRHKTAYILAHEQGHFDIAEIYARKLYQRMSAYKPGKNFQKDLGQIYENVSNEKAVYQQQYDRETNHSIKTDEQAAWLKKIAEELKATKEWKDYPRR
jgi:hypothetical protein